MDRLSWYVANSLICSNNIFGFCNLYPVKDSIRYEGIRITRIDAQHGNGATLKAMGLASGYILKCDTEPTVYITGDTIYNESVKENIMNYKPQILINSVRYTRKTAFQTKK